MNRKLCIGRVLLALVPLLTISSPARAALASRVFVAAKTGNDLNSCAAVATPCQTFAGAIAQVAAGGEIIVLESGGYGPLTITKAVNVNAPAGIVAFIHPPSGDAITVNAGPTDRVILRGLTLNGGTGNGITATAVGTLFVENCVITGYAGEGISFTAAGGTLFMKDGDVRGNGDGVVVTSAGATAHAVIRESSFSNNNGAGVLAEVGSSVTVTDSVAADNSGFGFFAKATTATNVNMTLSRVRAVGNGTGVAAETIGGSATGIAVILMADSVVTQNQTGATYFGNTSAVYGTIPGTSLVAGNVSDGSVMSNFNLR